ncbi:hypothetical protein NST28_23260 [Paenibacillus sp. FSL R10-2791]|uniref:hypothetical protein n=1 Tax=Paenibacillus sp. FSL R10-2791 TaxID=2954695 RepID=UPI0030F6BCBA
MKTFKDLEIVGQSEILDSYKNWMKELIERTQGWDIDQREELKDFIVIKKDKSPSSLKATLFLYLNDSKIAVTNIIPSDQRELNYDEYNFILDEFYRLFVINNPFNLRIDYSNENILIQDILTKEVSDRLIQFSRLANKSTGSSHPLDKKRWNDFVIRSFKANKIIDPQMLSRWLIEEETWEYSIASELAIDYEKAISLLAQYEEGD